jgi:N4-gp56 family major capsid protein
MNKMISIEEIMKINLRMFDGAPNTNISTDSGMTAEMKTFYDKDLLKIAEPLLVHNKFGQKRNIPKGNGKTIEFRKFDVLPKLTTALSEGVTPDGQKVAVTSFTATVKQYGGYVTHSDILSMTTIDNVILETNRLLGDQAGRTLDTLTREVINAGTNVQYSDSRVSARFLLVGGDATWANNHYFNCESIRQAALNLKNGLAKPEDGGSYVAIVHPDTTYMLMKDTEWTDVVKSQNADKIFKDEIGKYMNVRFVESTEAKIFKAANLTAAARDLTVASVTSKTFTMQEAITAGEATALVARKIIIKGVLYTVTASAAGSAGAATITVSETVTGSPTNGEKCYPGEAGAKGRDVYSTLIIGADAYGTTSIDGGGLQMIAKPLGSGGTSDALNQRGTQGWKAIHTAEILTELYMVRVEHTSPFVGRTN